MSRASLFSHSISWNTKFFHSWLIMLKVKFVSLGLPYSVQAKRTTKPFYLMFASGFFFWNQSILRSLLFLHNLYMLLLFIYNWYNFLRILSYLDFQSSQFYLQISILHCTEFWLNFCVAKSNLGVVQQFLP